MSAPKFRVQGNPEKHRQNNHDHHRSGSDEDQQDGDGDGRINARRERAALDLRRRSEMLKNTPVPIASPENTPRYLCPTPQVPTGSSQPYYLAPSAERQQPNNPMPRPSPNYVTSSASNFLSLPGRQRLRGPYSSPAAICQQLVDNFLYTDDLATGVRTVTTIWPNNAITEPDLLRKGARARMIIHSSDPYEARNYSNFEVRSTDFFRIGRVFYLLWAQPLDQDGDLSDTMTLAETAVRPGSEMPVKVVAPQVRCFVVIHEGSPDRPFCNVLPIVNYGQRGVAKPGVVKHHHAIAYVESASERPLAEEQPSRGERGMQEVPIRILPDEPGGKLNPTSRINFGSIYAVRYGVKVRPFGYIHPKSTQAFAAQLQKIHPDISTHQSTTRLAWARSAASTHSAGGQESRESSSDDESSDDEHETIAEAQPCSSKRATHRSARPARDAFMQSAEQSRILYARYEQAGYDHETIIDAMAKLLMQSNRNMPYSYAKQVVQQNLAYRSNS